MAASVTLRPSGRRFEVERGETVLEAALRSGVAIAYGCANGTCGECVATVVEGAVDTVRFHDFALPAADRLRGRNLLCAVAPASDLVVEAREAGGVEDLPHQSLRARVVASERRGAEHVIAHLKVIRGNAFRFLAGQRATLSFPGLAPRETWIASCPCDGVNLRFHFSRGSDPELVEHLLTARRRLDKVGVEGPGGSFTLDETSPRPLLLIAYDTGFAPVESLVEHALNLEIEGPMHLHWLVPREGGHYAHNQCRAWADAFDEIDYEPRVAPPGEIPAAIESALDRGAVLGAFDLYAAGPAPFVAEVRRRATHRGVDGRRVRTDSLA